SGTYYDINRTWRLGNVIELKLPMPARLVEANPLLEEARNQVAVQRGPLVYCLESPDLPTGTHLSEVAVATDMKLTPNFEPNVLGGVVILSGTATQSVKPVWADQLYRELPLHDARPIDIKLIPYFAWSNRGKSEMTVWLPLAR